MITDAIHQIQTELAGRAQLIAVTKTKPVAMLQEAYDAGCRKFGENKVQEMAEKQPQLPADVEWHLIGHLQTNKVKYIAPFVTLIHSVDSLKVAQEINKQAAKHNRTIDCLLQIYIADEETKFGLSAEEAEELLNNPALTELANVRIVGLMGSATNTDDDDQIRREFRGLKQLYDKLATTQWPHGNGDRIQFSELSMGMSGDYPIAVEEGSTLVRVGSAILARGMFLPTDFVYILGSWVAEPFWYNNQTDYQKPFSFMKFFIQSGAVLGLLGVALGAFGAHALQAMLEASGRTATFETAVRYQFYHALALVLVGILMQLFGSNPSIIKLLNYAGYSFLGGVLIFSGSLYILCFTGLTWLGAITPIGGVAMIAGWALLLWAFL